MKKSVLLLSLFVIFIPISAISEEKMKIAILDLKPVGVSAKISGIISNMLRTDLINTGKYTVIERTQMKEILGEQGFQQTGCTDQECAIQIGKLMSARKILIGEVSSMKKEMIITVRIVDVELGVSDYAARENAPDEKSLDSAIKRLSRKLTGEIGGRGFSPYTGYYLRGLIPGWAQLYSGQKIKGYIFLGSFMLTGAFMGYMIYDFNTKRSAYEDMKTGTLNDYNDKYKASEDAAKVAKLSAGLFAAVYIANLVDVIFFSNTDNLNLTRALDTYDQNKTLLTFDTYGSSAGNINTFNVMMSTHF